MNYLELLELITSNPYFFFLVCTLFVASILFCLLLVLVAGELLIDLFSNKYKQPFKEWPRKSNDSEES